MVGGGKKGWRKKKERTLKFCSGKESRLCILFIWERFIEIDHVLDHKETLDTYIKAQAHRSYVLWL